MSTKEYRIKARNLLSGIYSEGFMVLAVLAAVFVIFRIADFMLAAAMVYGEKYSLAQLMCTERTAGVLYRLFRCLTCFAVTVPLLTGGFWWYLQTALGEDNGNILKIYSGIRLNTRAAAVYGLMWIRGFASLIPTAVCWSAAWELLNIACRQENHDIMIFGAFQLGTAGFFLLLLWIYNGAATAAAPFLFIRHPDAGAFRTIKNSAALMKGRKTQFIKLMLCYIPAMIPLVTIPFVLPRAVMAAAVFVSEEENFG